MINQRHFRENTGHTQSKRIEGDYQILQWTCREHRLDVHRLHPPRFWNLPEEERTGLQKIRIRGLGNNDGFYISFLLPLLEWVISRLEAR
jgi:hypothetical protein